MMPPGLATQIISANAVVGLGTKFSIILDTTVSIEFDSKPKA
jgi:hypothetical protein